MQSRDADIKDQVRNQYAKIALTGNSESCCMPSECCGANDLGYSYPSEDLKSIPEASILGVGCGAPLNFAELKKGETVVDLGSGAGIDVFLSANKVGREGKVIGIDMTDEMLEKARRIAKENGYINVDFRKGDIEKEIPVPDNTVDLVISNCVINLTSNKVNAFKQAHRILKTGGRIVISDLVTDREVPLDAVNDSKWCSCIDGTLTKEHYLDSIRSAGFCDIRVLKERLYLEEGGKQVVDGRKKITSVVIKAVKV